MKHNIEISHEQVSALADGQLHGEAFANTVAGLAQASDARQTWHAYHVVGDVLRAGEPVNSARDVEFLARLKLGLQQEPSRVQRDDATDLIAAYASSTGARGRKGLKSESANQSQYRLNWLAGLASLALVSVLGWQAISAIGESSGVPLLARLAGQADTQTAGLASAASPESTIMLRDPQLDALLAAHRQVGGTSALQMPSGFLRNATYEGAAR